MGELWVGANVSRISSAFNRNCTNSEDVCEVCVFVSEFDMRPISCVCVCVLVCA